MLKPAFDTYAAQYDKHFTETSIGKLQRSRVHFFLNRILKPASTILELNCGTGEDARQLSTQGHRVLATDISPEMVRLAEKKNRSENTAFAVCAIQELFLLQDLRSFDVIFSNFGGLNCVSPSELSAAVPYFEKLTGDNGILAFVVMGRRCLWEILYFRWKNKKELSRRRTEKEGIVANILEQSFMTYYYAPHELAKIVQPSFDVLMMRPVGLFIPPSYLEPFFAKKQRLLKALSWMENKIGYVPLFSNFSDHYLIIFKKKPL